MAHFDGIGITESKAAVFICNAPQDLAFAGRLAAALVRLGVNVLPHPQEGDAPDFRWESTEALIGHADAVAIVLSPDSVKTDALLKAVAYATSLHKRLAPITYRQVEDANVPPQLRWLNFFIFDHPSEFEVDAERPGRALQNDAWIGVMPGSGTPRIVC
jgi:hypothetical protein